MNKYTDEELIERQSARDVIYNDLVANKTEYTLDFRRGMAYASALLILEPPAVDAAEVRHGTWIVHKTETIAARECSVCHSRIQYLGNGYPHCPYCLARMDGEEEHNAAD